MNSSRLGPLFLTLFLAACVAIPSGEPRPSEAELRVLALTQVERIAVVGASASAGYMSDFPLARALGAVWAEARVVSDTSTPMFFASPRRVAAMQLALVATRDHATCLVGFDFLFWFAYGDKSYEERLRGLEEGFALLADFEGPVFLGDIPDMRGASPMVLAEDWVPEEVEFGALNRRVRALAAARPGTFVLPVATWNVALRNGDPVTVGGKSVREAPDEALSWDRLHPSPRGIALIALLIAQELRGRLPGLREDDFLADIDTLLERMGAPHD